ncbi:MAG TPA: hypothetical protein VND91_08475 [Candidatus Saccharimonadia bacterium]|nr:hypothetical protein [Candidatus Saccharimonadia bacterium]
MKPTWRLVSLISLVLPASALAQAPVAAPLASQETNMAGVTAEVTEFKRRGNTLTAKVRLSNAGTESVSLDMPYSKAYVLDATGGKKYEVLRDDQKNYIALLGPSYDDRYWDTLKAGQKITIWMKFPAPPAEVKTVTLQLDDMAPFDELAIQD